MSLLRVSVIAAALAAPLWPALGADVPGSYPRAQPLPRLERTTTRLVEPNSGWYLRGDVGYNWGKVGSAESPPGLVSPTAGSLGNGMNGGIGGGIKSSWFRADVTLDYTSPMKYQGTIVTPGDVTAKISAWNILANGYFDLGSWYRATPYVGAGIGGSWVRTTDYSNVADPLTTGGLIHDHWNVAWAGMAGVAYAIAPNMMIDVGYRYLSLGDIKSASTAVGHTTFKNVATHQVRVGVRWSFDDMPSGF